MISYLPSGQSVGAVAFAMEAAMDDVAAGEITQAVRDPPPRPARLRKAIGWGSSTAMLPSSTPSSTRC